VSLFIAFRRCCNEIWSVLVEKGRGRERERENSRIGDELPQNREEQALKTVGPERRKGTSSQSRLFARRREEVDQSRPFSRSSEEVTHKILVESPRPKRPRTPSRAMISFAAATERAS